jgi:two-component system, cell cycle response regulator
MKPTILLVDDNIEILEVLADELNEKYEIITAINGQEALNKLKEGDIQLVVCDVMMPVMDGFEFCKIVKSDFEYSHVPVILLTAKNTLQSRIAGLELGADAYIEKPFDVEHLLVQIANLIMNRNKLREYFAQSPVAQIKTIAHTRSDEKFLDKLNEAILANLDDQNLDIDKLAKLMNTSRTSLFRKIKSIAGLTPNDLINITRLKKAAQLLAEAHYKIFEVAYMVGFSSHTSFGRSFYKQFGMSPTEYQKQNQENKK